MNNIVSESLKCSYKSVKKINNGICLIALGSQRN